MPVFKTPLKAPAPRECRRDGECGCKMCRASIHATMDLRPSPSTPFASTFTRSNLDSDSDSDSDINTKYLQSHPISRLRSLQPMSSSSSSSPWFSARRRLFLVVVIVCVLGFLWPSLGKFREAMLTPARFVRIAEGSLAKPGLLDRLDFLQDQMWLEDSFSSSSFSSISNCTETANWRLIEVSMVMQIPQNSFIPMQISQLSSFTKIMNAHHQCMIALSWLMYDGLLDTIR